MGMSKSSESQVLGRTISEGHRGQYLSIVLGCKRRWLTVGADRVRRRGQGKAQHREEEHNGLSLHVVLVCSSWRYGGDGFTTVSCDLGLLDAALDLMQLFTFDRDLRAIGRRICIFR